jgi:hypothetical protein
LSLNKLEHPYYRLAILYVLRRITAFFIIKY